MSEYFIKIPEPVIKAEMIYSYPTEGDRFYIVEVRVGGVEVMNRKYSADYGEPNMVWNPEEAVSKALEEFGLALRKLIGELP